MKTLKVIFTNLVLVLVILIGQVGLLQAQENLGAPVVLQGTTYNAGRLEGSTIRVCVMGYRIVRLFDGVELDLRDGESLEVFAWNWDLPVTIEHPRSQEGDEGKALNFSNTGETSRNVGLVAIFNFLHLAQGDNGYTYVTHEDRCYAGQRVYQTYNFKANNVDQSHFTIEFTQIELPDDGVRGRSPFGPPLNLEPQIPIVDVEGFDADQPILIPNDFEDEEEPNEEADLDLDNNAVGGCSLTLATSTGPSLSLLFSMMFLSLPLLLKRRR